MSPPRGGFNILFGSLSNNSIDIMKPWRCTWLARILLECCQELPCNRRNLGHNIVSNSLDFMAINQTNVLVSRGQQGTILGELTKSFHHWQSAWDINFSIWGWRWSLTGWQQIRKRWCSYRPCFTLALSFIPFAHPETTQLKILNMEITISHLRDMASRNRFNKCHYWRKPWKSYDWL